jgi:ribosome-associated protein
VVVIKAQSHRTQDMNRLDALARLMELVDSVAQAPKKRKATRPTYASKLRRLESKKKTSAIKSNRGRVM